MAYNGHPVIAFIPYGRRETVSILLPYLRREHEKGLLDELWLCLNTDPEQVDDLTYAYELARDHSWVKAVDRPAECPRRVPKQRNTGTFYRYMTDPDAVYVRFDDDIVYVHEQALERIVDSKLRMTTSLTAFPIIWNNAVCSWHLQQRGVIPGESQGWAKVAIPYCMDAVGWADGDFAVRMHRLLLERIRENAVESCFMYQDVPLAPRQQFSVSCFATLGADYCELTPPGVLDYDEEEHWHTVHRPQLVGKPNIIIGDALVSHYTFYPQQAVVRATDILDQYRELAEKL